MSDSIGVLVMEDEKPLLDAIKSKLERAGFEVVTARTAEAGINMLRDGVDVQVIWLDHYLLGGETGLDFLAKVKEHEEWKNLPIFVVSNTAGPEKQRAYLQLGVTKYFTKSTARLDEIIAEVNKSLESSE